MLGVRERRGSGYGGVNREFRRSFVVMEIGFRGLVRFGLVSE